MPKDNSALDDPLHWIPEYQKHIFPVSNHKITLITAIYESFIPNEIRENKLAPMAIDKRSRHKHYIATAIDGTQTAYTKEMIPKPVRQQFKRFKKLCLKHQLNYKTFPIIWEQYQDKIPNIITRIWEQIETEETTTVNDIQNQSPANEHFYTNDPDIRENTPDPNDDSISNIHKAQIAELIYTLEQHPITEPYNDPKSFQLTIEPEKLKRMTENEIRKLRKKQFRNEICHRINEKILNTLHEDHPFHTINFCPYDHTPFQIIPQNQLQSNDTISHYQNYLRLFYDYNFVIKHQNIPNICNLCNVFITASIHKHILIDCNNIKLIHQAFWQTAHQQLREIYNTPNTIPQLRFGQFILQTIETLTKSKDNIWKIICGANYHYTLDDGDKDNPFAISHIAYTHRNYQKYQYKNDKFYKQLCLIIGKWITITKAVFKEPNKRKYHMKRYETPPPINHSYHQWINTKEKLDEFFEKINKTSKDIIIYTDGSYEEIDKETKSGGIGIYIEYDNRTYHFSQSMYG
eukprot:732827_1